MYEIAERPTPLSKVHEEFGMSPARDPHNDFVGQLYFQLRVLLGNSSLMVKIDTFRYLDDWLINSFGDFKNVMNLDRFTNGLKRFGASMAFIQSKLREYAGAGTIPPGYAPDVFITSTETRSDQFAIPLAVFEVVSQYSREHDFHFKPFFYETIGVREYFICESKGETGVISRAYRLQENEYAPIPLEQGNYASEIVGQPLPRIWTF